MSLGAPIHRRKLYQEVLDRFIDAITSREYPPGSQFPSERELTMQLGVGRPAIREAMLTLQQMGLLRISHGERARVVNPTLDIIIQQMSAAMVMMLATNPRGLDELKRARIDLECGLVRQATQAASREDIQRLGDAQRALEAAKGDAGAFVIADMAFHGLIADIAGNALVAVMLRAMLDWLSRFKTEMVSVRGADKLTIDEHERIFQAVVSGKAQEAAAAMHDHLSRANDLYRRLSADGAAADGARPSRPINTSRD